MKIFKIVVLVTSIIILTIFAAGCKNTVQLDDLDVWDLVYIGDPTSTGVPEKLAENIERATGKSVQVHTYLSEGISAVEVLHALRNETGSIQNFLLMDLQELVKEAEVIVLFATPEGDPSVTGDFGNCIRGGVTPPKDCGPGTYGSFGDNLQAIYDEIFSLREGKETIIRATDFYNPMISQFRKNNTEDECTYCSEVFCNILHEAAESNKIPFVSVYDAFNGPDHDQDPGEKGYLGSMNILPSEKGQQVIADLLSEVGYDPVEPK